MAWGLICCQLSRAAICACLATGMCVGSVTLELWVRERERENFTSPLGVMRGTCSWSALLLQISGWYHFSSLVADCSGVMDRLVWARNQPMVSRYVIACLEGAAAVVPPTKPGWLIGAVPCNIGAPVTGFVQGGKKEGNVLIPGSQPG